MNSDIQQLLKEAKEEIKKEVEKWRGKTYLK